MTCTYRVTCNNARFYFLNIIIDCETAVNQEMVEIRRQANKQEQIKAKEKVYRMTGFENFQTVKYIMYDEAQQHAIQY